MTRTTTPGTVTTQWLSTAAGRLITVITTTAITTHTRVGPTTTAATTAATTTACGMVATTTTVTTTTAATTGVTRFSPWRLLPLAAAVSAPVLVHGGFTSGSRSLFVGLAAVAVALAVVEDERALFSAFESSIVRCLLALAALAALSSIWTVAGPGAAVRWGFVIGAYAATVAVAACAGRRQIVPLALILVGLAAIEAAVGLTAAGLRVGPYAERIGGNWRPGGTFEYPPALALIQVMALPALLRWMVGARPARAATAAAAAALAGAVVALATSRTELVLGILVLALAVATSRRTLGVSRGGALMAAAVPLAAGIAALMASGGYAFPGATGGDLRRLIALAAIPIAPAGAWGIAWRLAVPRLSRPTSVRNRRHVIAAVAVLVVIAAGIATLHASAPSGPRPWVEPVSGFTHGRAAQWEAAVDTATDRPLLGAGSEAYLEASARHQGAALSLYAHDLPLETWAELGPLGLALAVALYVFAARLLWRIRDHPQAWLLAPAVAAFLLASLVDWTWHLAGAGAVWALALGACIRAR
jgi:O-antigen ligase/polysaccharide polymerase Wzy-like membrane protein